MNYAEKKINVFAFDTYEGLVDHFVQSTGIFFPKMAAGRSEFFRAFSQWLNRSTQSRSRAVITPDPAQGLALPNALQILTSALNQSRKNAGTAEASELLEKYGLTPKILTQPVNTLSGGELLLLNFAKAEAQCSHVKGLAACNPVFWLSPARHKFWLNLCDSYEAADKNVEALVLRGDHLDSSSRSDKFSSVDALSVNLLIDSPLVNFPEIQFPVFHAASKLLYSWVSETDEVFSPFLITGDNGVGKSIFARLLAGILPISSGRAAIMNPDDKRTVRLLFQEAITQLFAMSPFEYLGKAFSASIALFNEATGLFRELMQSIYSDKLSGDTRNWNSLLAGKACLIAARLAEKPALILLDEPGWGLSRHDAGMLVFHTCRLAHQRETGVGIISHQPEWHDFARSNLKLKKIAPEQVEISHARL